MHTPNAENAKILETFQPMQRYVFTLKGLGFLQAEARPGQTFEPRDQIRATLAYDAQPEITLDSYLSISFGTYQGKVALFKQFCNAVLGFPANTKVEGFDDSSFEVYYATGRHELRAGAKVVAIGEYKERADGSQAFRLTYFEPVTAHTAMAPAAAIQTPVTAAVAPQSGPAPVPVTTSGVTPATYSNGQPIDPANPLF